MSEAKNSVIYLKKFLRPYRWTIILTFIFLTAGRVFSSLDPIWLKKIIDSIGTNKDFAALIPLLATYFSLYLFRIIADYLRDFTFAPATQGISKGMSQALFAHLLYLPVSYHHEQKLGALSKKITRGSRAIALILDILTLSLLPTFIELIIVTGLLLKLYSPIYAIATFSTVILYTVFTVWGTEKRQKYRIAANVAEDDVSSLELDAIGNIDTVKYFNNEPTFIERHAPVIGNWYRLTVASNRLFSLVASGQGFILMLGMGTVLVTAVRQALGGALTTGDLILLTTYVVRLTAPIDTLGFIYRQIKDNLTDLQGISRILQEEITIAEPKNPIVIEKPKGDVLFENVEFHYNTGRTVLKDVNLEIKPGQRVAFVGPSGVGKSTIVKLLFRFFEPTHGQIRIDGIPLNELAKESRYDIFGIVPQEPALFNTTIAENIRFGKPDATDEEVIAAAKLASIHHFIDTLPEKYESIVGERGVKLSGGEKQRVAIARAIIRNPKVLVFDEATSSLDSHSEKEIQESLEKVSKGRTTIAVAHRLSTIANSDTIYVLNKGGVAEQGTHAELLKKDGLYAQLWRTQAQQKPLS